MSTHFLDRTVLIAQTVADHERHVRASATAGFVVCPVVEAALVWFRSARAKAARPCPP